MLGSASAHALKQGTYLRYNKMAAMEQGVKASVSDVETVAVVNSSFILYIASIFSFELS